MANIIHEEEAHLSCSSSYISHQCTHVCCSRLTNWMLDALEMPWQSPVLVLTMMSTGIYSWTQKTLFWTNHTRTSPTWVLLGKLGIPGANRCQVLKETAQRHGIDTMSLNVRAPGRRIHVRKRRLPGSDISVGCGPSTRSLQNMGRNDSVRLDITQVRLCNYSISVNVITL